MCCQTRRSVLRLHRQRCLTRQHHRECDPITQGCQHQHHREAKRHAQHQRHRRPDDGEEAIDTPGPRHQRGGFLATTRSPRGKGSPSRTPSGASRRSATRMRQTSGRASAAGQTTGVRNAVPTTVTRRSGMIQRRCCRGWDCQRPASAAPTPCRRAGRRARRRRCTRVARDRA